MNNLEVDYLLAIINPLIQYPESVNVDKKTDDKGVFLIVTVAQPDMGRIIGKMGVTATAIRNLMRQFGMTNKMHISIKIDDPEKSARNSNFHDQDDSYKTA